MIPSTNTYSILIFSLFLCLTLKAQTKIEFVDKPQLSFICAELPITERATARSVIAKNALWDIGQTIKVGFLNGSPLLQDTVKQIVQQWAKYANVQFKFVTTGKTNIRIFFDENSIISYSSIGTYSRYVNQAKPTMVLAIKETNTATLLRRVILHEFGHALGLFHEHQHPENDIEWNKEVVYQHYAQIGWSKGLVDYYVFNKFSKSITQFCDYDPNSIMHYPIPSAFTTDNFVVGVNDTLSIGDTRFIKKVYPFDKSSRNLGDLCNESKDSILVIDEQLNLRAKQFNNFSIPIKIGTNFPNPFTNQTTIPFWLAKKSKIEWTIYTVTGQQLHAESKIFESGWHQQELADQVFPKAGVYIYHFQMGTMSKAGRMIRL